LIVGYLYAVITVLAWGTWLTPSQNLPFRNQQIKTFYVAGANLALALVVALLQRSGQLTPGIFWLPYLGGLVWSVSGFLAFTATHRVGMAKAFGIWAPVNIVVSILWGSLLFNEFLDTSPLSRLWLVLSVVVILAGVLLITMAPRGYGVKAQGRNAAIGFLSAVGAGILWGTYFIPIKLSQTSMWIAALPLAVGIFTGSALLALLARQPLRLDKSGDYLRVAVTGLLWGIGNYGMLLLVEDLGAGKGFTISQLSVVVNALIGVYWLKDPRPKTRAAALTLAGCVLATLGGIVFGNLK
jgi:glucose uptake protein